MGLFLLPDMRWKSIFCGGRTFPKINIAVDVVSDRNKWLVK